MLATTVRPLPRSRRIPLAPVQRDTVNKIFLGAIDRFGGERALLFKSGGAWTPLSHRDVEERATRLAAALAAYGIEPGDHVAILSENRPEWAITDYAALGMGAVTVPIYPTLPPNQVAYILEDSGARAVFASTAAQVQKLAGIRGGLSRLRLVAAFDHPAGADDVVGFDNLLEIGRRELEAGRGGGFRERALAVGRDQVATLIYTSGTTGTPKGVMLTHWNLASNVAGTLQHGLDVLVHQGDTALSFLPLSHIFQRMVDYLCFERGCTIAYAESIDKVADDLLEVRPDLAVSVPRVFEKIYAKVTGATGVKKRIVGWAARVGGTVADARLAGGRAPWFTRLQYWLADRLVFAKLRARTGGRMRCFVSGGAPLAPEIARFFIAAGIPVYEGYGLTETSPVLAANRPGAVRLGTVGQVIPGTEVVIGDGGEILARGPGVMQGYWNLADATAEVMDGDGWLHTGDIGELDDDGFLRITDRIKNLLVTSGGKKIAPQPMENLAALSPYVAQVVMIGDRRPFPVLLVVPEFETLRVWAAAQGVPADDRAALVRDPRVQELLRGETLGRLTGFARYELPKKLLVLPGEFSIDDGTLTPTLKVRRRIVEQRYAAEIERLYAGHAVAG